MNIITIDGHSASGKGTLARKIATKLHWNLLDSGALYRVVAYIADCYQLIDDNQTIDIDRLCELIQLMNIEFDHQLEGLATKQSIVIRELDLPETDINRLIRNETIGEKASLIASNSTVRRALLDYQRNSYKLPGLVADGRDMGSVVFPNAKLKVFLTASIEERAKRRYYQLLNQGESVNLAALVEQLTLRDDIDSKRQHSPLVVATDAIVIDSSQLAIEAVYNLVWQQVLSTFDNIVTN